MRGERGKPVWAGVARLVSGAALLTCASAQAQEAPPLRGRGDGAHEAPITCLEGAGECVTLIGVTIDGARAIPATDLAEAYEPYLTRSVSMDDLARIADAITTRYREAGYFLSRALVPAQDWSAGLVRILVIEGRISEVSVTGPAGDAVRPLIGDPRTDGPARLAELDARLARASDAPGLTLRSRIEPDPADPAAHRLIVEAERAPLEAEFSLDNRGPDAAGPLQAYGRVTANGVFLDRDQASLSVFFTPADPDELVALEAAYAFQLGNGGAARIAAFASRAEDGANAASPSVGGDGHGVSLVYEHPLLRRRGAGLWLGAGFDARHAVNDWSGGGGFVDETRVARVLLRGFLDAEGRASAFAAEGAFGLDLFGASGHSEFARSRADADAAFARFNLHASHYRDLGPFMGLYASLDAQWTGEPLLLSQEFDVGGPLYGRAYMVGELSGDRGVAGSLELRAGYDPPGAALSFVQTYAFVDAARVWNFGRPPGEGADSLSSAGAGVRVSFADWLMARMELARPLSRLPYGENEREWRRFFSITATY